MKELQVAIAGYGKGGRIYNAPIISSVDGFRVSMILTSGNVEAARNDFPDATIVSDFDEIISNEDIDLVVLTLPNHLHHTTACRVLEAGKHVVVEKPFTPTVKEAESLIKLAKKKGLLLTVNHNRRWDSDILTIQKIIGENMLGDIVEFESHFDRFRTEVKDTWKEDKDIPGSGILYDLGSHLIDQALMLFGHPKEVFADLRMQREYSEVIDNFELLLFYPNLKVTLKAGMLVKIPGPTYSLFGRKGSYIKFGRDPQEKMLQAGKKPRDENHWGEEPSTIWGKAHTLDGEEIIESEVGDYRQFYINVYNSIMGLEKLLMKPDEALDVIKVIELAIKSNKNKCRVKFK